MKKIYRECLEVSLDFFCEILWLESIFLGLLSNGRKFFTQDAFFKSNIQLYDQICQNAVHMTLIAGSLQVLIRTFLRKLSLAFYSYEHPRYQNILLFLVGLIAVIDQGHVLQVQQRIMKDLTPNIPSTLQNVLTVLQIIT